MQRLKSLRKLNQELGLRATIESILFHLSPRRTYLVNYPITSLTLEVNKGPLAFWRRLERGLWEINRIRFIVDLVKPGEVILDIGAWIGPLTFLFSHLVGKTGKIYAFEPIPESFSLLEYYTASNNIGNVYSFNMAVSDVVDYVTLYFPSSASIMATMLKPRKLERKHRIEQKCKCTTIDEFCGSQKIHPNGIKINVEGAEGYVFDGAIESIKKYHPWCLLEFHGNRVSESERQRIWSFITRRAKKIVYIEGNEVELTYGLELPFDFQPTKRANYCIFF